MTNKFIWDEEYSVGIPSLDAQHKDFFQIANDIIDGTDNQTATSTELLAMARKLEEHGFIHLDTEEGYFDKLHYPGAPEHIKAHELYRKKIKHYIELLSAPDADTKLLAQEIASFAIHWLSDHILMVDKHYTKFLQSHGVC